MKDFYFGNEDFNVTYSNSKVNEEYTLDDLHDVYEFVYSIKSDMRIFIGGSCHEIKDGDMFFINPQVAHHIFYNRMKHYERYVIHFKKSYISEILKSLELQQVFAEMEGSTLKKASAGLKCASRLEALFRSFEAGAGLEIQRNKLILLLILLEYYEEIKKTKLQVQMPKKTLQGMQIVRYLDAHYCEEISLAMLEKEFFLNKYHISHLFKEATGFSVFQYVQYRRILEAQRLLKQTGKEVNDVCFDCGFSSVQSFYKAFGRIAGTTPVKFRKQFHRKDL